MQAAVDRQRLLLQLTLAARQELMAAVAVAAVVVTLAARQALDQQVVKD